MRPCWTWGPNPGGLVLISEDVLVRRGTLGRRNGPWRRRQRFRGRAET